MTGFGRGEHVTKGVRYQVELSSVNRKQLDIVVNLPREFHELEPSMRKVIEEVTVRGRVTVNFTYEQLEGNDTHIEVDEALAQQYTEAFQKVAAAVGQPLELTPTDLFRAHGVFRVVHAPIEIGEAQLAATHALQAALEGMLRMREEEGAHLQKDLEGRLEELSQAVEQIEALVPALAETYRKQLQKRLVNSGLEISLDDDRILKEIALYADKCDVSEELVRIKSHFKQMDRFFESDEPMGRSIDFLLQEVNRELNTVGAKANHAEISHHIVFCKAEIEKMREQVQNIE